MSSLSSLRFLPKTGSAGAGDGYCFDGGVALEVTVLSADSLRLPPSYSPLPRRLRPYVTVSSPPPPSDAPAAASACCSSSTSVATPGAGHAAWGDTLAIPVGAAFLEGRADVRVAVLSEPACRLVGATPLGWCGIPAADVLDGLRPPRALRRLSYSLRCPGLGGGHGVLHLAVRVLGLRDAAAAAMMPAPPVQQGWCSVAMGIPVSGASSAAAAAVVGMPLSWGATSR
ncbi:hypothetical protein BS78_01G379700 [Paspalum vaginatum]|nr:hypothetical protein BS78_01G379700 [Paspalum vaginatum]